MGTGGTIIDKHRRHGQFFVGRNPPLLRTPPNGFSFGGVVNLCKRSQVHANANYPYDSLIPPKNKNEGLHFRADTGVRPYAFKFLDVGVTLSVVTRFRMCVDGSPTTIFAINFLDAVM